MTPPLSTAPPSAVAERVHRAALRLLRTLRQEDAATGVGPAQLSALSVLVFGGDRTLGELAAAEGVRPPTMSRIVAALVAAGLARRRDDPRDRRRIHLVATAAGQRLTLAGRDRRLRRLDALLRGLGAHEVETLERAAALLERMVSAAAAEFRGGGRRRGVGAGRRSRAS
jgi:DNA-binding MarR family transcriptional regulator